MKVRSLRAEESGNRILGLAEGTAVNKLYHKIKKRR